MSQGPKILALDIETSPILAWVWALYDQTIALNQIHTDTYILSWSAKWLGAKEVMYKDQRNSKDLKNDKPLLEPLWKLMNEADIILTQNGKDFDEPRLNARFVIHGMGKPAPYQHIDTLKIAKGKFKFTSNKLEYLTDKLNTKYKKLKHKEFPGFELWKECLAGNKDAWAEMEKYNKHDVLALEELYTQLAPWDTSVSHALYMDDKTGCPGCGGYKLIRQGVKRTKTGVFARYSCKDCGSWSTGATNQIKPKDIKRHA